MVANNSSNSSASTIFRLSLTTALIAGTATAAALILFAPSLTAILNTGLLGIVLFSSAIFLGFLTQIAIASTIVAIGAAVACASVSAAVLELKSLFNWMHKKSAVSPKTPEYSKKSSDSSDNTFAKVHCRMGESRRSPPVPIEDSKTTATNVTTRVVSRFLCGRASQNISGDTMPPLSATQPHSKAPQA